LLIFLFIDTFLCIATAFVFQQKPSFELSGKLAEETNKVGGAGHKHVAKASFPFVYIVTAWFPELTIYFLSRYNSVVFRTCRGSQIRY
jgi:hypothetical protein